MKPKVSICIPTYKQTEFLAKTLDSIKIQNFKDFEIIITDDSPDNSVEQLLSDYDFEGKLKYIKNKVSKGSPANWNEAIKHANGEYIKIMHHDDWFTKETSLQTFVELLDNNPNADFAFSGCLNYSGNQKKHHFVEEKKLKKLRNDPFVLLLGNIIGAPSVTIHRSSVLLTYDESLKWLVDLDFYIQLILHNSNFSFTQEPLISICSNGEHQVTKECENNISVEVPEYIHAYNKYINLFNFKINEEHEEYLINLFSRYNITKIEKLKDLPLTCELPASIESLFSLNKRFRMYLRIWTYIISNSYFVRRIKTVIKTVLNK